MVSRTKAIAALAIVLIIIGSLIWVGVTRASSYYLTVDEAVQKGSSIHGDTLKVSGNIAYNSVQWNPDTLTLQFRVQGTSNSNSIPVIYHGVKPSDFSNGWPVVVDGTIGDNGIMKANQLLVKCPSKYEAAQQQMKHDSITNQTQNSNQTSANH